MTASGCSYIVVIAAYFVLYTVNLNCICYQIHLKAQEVTKRFQRYVAFMGNPS